MKALTRDEAAYVRNRTRAERDLTRLIEARLTGAALASLYGVLDARAAP